MTCYCENVTFPPVYKIIIVNVGDYLYLKNGSFKFEVDPHHFNAKWLIMLGFMDWRRPRVVRRCYVGLVYFVAQLMVRTNISRPNYHNLNATRWYREFGVFIWRGPQCNQWIRHRANTRPMVIPTHEILSNFTLNLISCTAENITRFFSYT